MVQDAASKRSLTDSMRHIKGVPIGEKGMVLPFQPMHLTFSDICYYVDFPKVRPTATTMLPNMHMLKLVFPAMQSTHL